MKEKDFDYESKPPEFRYEISDAKLQSIQAVTKKFEIALESMHENLSELKIIYSRSKSKNDKTKLSEEITKYEEAIETNNKILREFYNAINYWEIELEKGATEILLKFKIDDILPN